MSRLLLQRVAGIRLRGAVDKGKRSEERGVVRCGAFFSSCPAGASMTGWAKRPNGFRIHGSDSGRTDRGHRYTPSSLPLASLGALLRLKLAGERGVSCVPRGLRGEPRQGKRGFAVPGAQTRGRFFSFSLVEGERSRVSLGARQPWLGWEKSRMALVGPCTLPACGYWLARWMEGRRRRGGFVLE